MCRVIRVYYLEHTYEAEGCVNTNTLGLFPDEASAQKAAASMADQPGFREYPLGFQTREAEVHVPEDEKLSSGQEIYCAFCHDYRMDDEGTEHETIMEGALFAAKADAENELNEWRLGGLLDDAEEGDAGIGSWELGVLADGWKDGFEIYRW